MNKAMSEANSTINLNVFIQDKEVINLLTRVDKESNGIISKALKNAIRPMEREAVKNIKQVAHITTTHEKWKKKPLDKGICITQKKGETMVKLHLFGDGRLRWFEEGTRERKTKDVLNKSKRPKHYKGKNRGQMKATGFFTKAYEAKKDEVEKNIENAFLKELDKIIK